MRCLYLSADPTCPQTLHLAQVAQFKFVDLKLDFEIRRSEMRPTPETASFKKVADLDLPALARIARESHCETRFFHELQFPIDPGSRLIRSLDPKGSRSTPRFLNF